MITMQLPDFEIRLGELVGEQAETRNNACPSPIFGANIEDLNLKRVAWFRSHDLHRPGDGMDHTKIQIFERIDGATRHKLSIGRLFRLQLHDFARLNGRQWRDAVIPATMRMIETVFNIDCHNLL